MCCTRVYARAGCVLVVLLAMLSMAMTGCSSAGAITSEPQTVDTPVFSVAAGTYASAQTVSISTATSGAQIYYTSNLTTPTPSATLYTGPVTVSSSETLEAIAVKANQATSAVASAAYVIDLAAAAAPTFSVPAGTYASAQTVALSTTTPNAQIFYTTDNTTPTTSSTLYTGPISVTSSETIQAIATASGAGNSSIASASYTINLVVPTVTLSVTPTSFSLTSPSPAVVHVSCNTACGQVNLQIDGAAWQSGTLDSSGTYSSSAYPPLTAGPHTLQAFYLGSSSYAAVSSNLVAFTISAPAPGGAHAVLSTNFLAFENYGSYRDITLSNTGNAPLLISSIATYTPYFSETDNCAGTVPSGGSCTLSVVDYAAVVFPFQYQDWTSDQLVITSNDPAGTLGAALVSEPPPAPATVASRSNIAFASTLIGSSATDTVSLTGTSPQCVSGASGTDFTVTVLTASPCTLQVTFTPTATGIRTGQYTVASDGSFLPLLGIGASSSSSIATLTPSSVTIQDFNGPAAVTLSNFASTPLGIQSISISNGFTQTNTCGTSLPAQTVCTITVLMPSAAVAKGIEGLLTVVDDQGTQTAQLVGIIDTPLEFGPWPIGTVSPYFQQVSPTSYTSLVGYATGADPQDFSVVNQVVTDGVQQATVAFKPTQTGLRSASETLDESGLPQPTLLLQGTGLPAQGSGPLLTVIPLPTIALPVGTTSIYGPILNNAGTTAITLTRTGVATSGPDAQDFLFTLNGSSTLQPDTQAAPLELTLAPTSTGTRSANLNLTDTTSGQTFTIPFSFIGTPAAPLVTPPSSISAQTGTTSTVTFTVSPLNGDPLTAYLDFVASPYTAQMANPFALVKSTCAQGESPCQITLSFSPTTDTYNDAGLFLVDTVTGSPATVKVVGTINPGTLTLTPSTLDFGTHSINTTSVAQPLTLTSTHGTQSFFPPTVTGANASEFPITTNCGAQLTDASCTISVSFAPVSSGTKSASVTVTYGSAQSLTTTLTGVAQ